MAMGDERDGDVALGDEEDAVLEAFADFGGEQVAVEVEGKEWGGGLRCGQWATGAALSAGFAGVGEEV